MADPVIKRQKTKASFMAGLNVIKQGFLDQGMNDEAARNETIGYITEFADRLCKEHKEDELMIRSVAQEIENKFMGAVL